jgi:aryl-alcohol dehydrogenase-like predicted oxidoreductase
MRYRKLGTTDLEVSLICLGTMTWGEQNTEAEAHAQLDLAFERGVNFIDTAELYPVPPNAATQGRTEAYIGSWLRSRGVRDQVVIATKIAGPGPAHFRDGQTVYDQATLEAAVQTSLERLQTDSIDLYQLHWPTRKTNFFSRLGYVVNPDEEGVEAAILETLEALAGLQRTGRIRHIGLSNETAWGVMTFLQLAASHGLPRVQSVQNPYSLLNRSYEIGLAEVSHRERCGLLAYSPLGFGTLTGKYLAGERPPQARLSRFQQFQRYFTAAGEAATERYVSLAREAGMAPASMALAYVNSRRFVTSTIIGATSLEQLQANIDSVDVVLEPSLIEAIDAVHTEHPNPCP